MSLKYTYRPGGSAYCPECKEAISQQANICPHCRSDLKENEEWQAKKANSSEGCAMILICGLASTGVIGATLYNFMG